MKNKVLITSVGRKVSLVKAFKDAGWVVHGNDDDLSCVGLKFCDNIFSGNLDEYDLVVPTRDGELLEYVGFPLIASRETIETCIDKFKFYKFCKANGFKTPEVYFVKPRISKSGKETECVWQEMVEGEEYTIDVFVWKEVIGIVPRKRIRVTNGESSVTETVPLEPFLQQTKDIVLKLGLVGHNTLQCFLTNLGIVWTDVNCRFGGASIVSIKAGLRSPEWLLKIVNKEELKPCIGEYKVGLMGRSYSEWTFNE